jgi:hypothetical protein
MEVQLICVQTACLNELYILHINLLYLLEVLRFVNKALCVSCKLIILYCIDLLHTQLYIYVCVIYI